ncbi:hypothetical protein RF11_06954 [Thelohanellus kitauei]|uniref:Uncharacterized protein n=1 Tax=Thelohanellus kitauei TaxID=669202 RepID=A0A0C2M4H0_THEKT|nr:hypothetical protein RF11_06954 [Thelohanellus kitauei]
MNMSCSHIVFIALMGIAFLLTVQLIAGSVFPMMFTLIRNHTSGHRVAVFGPFNWYHDGRPMKYHSVTVLFAFIQVMYITATASSVVALCCAIVGYANKRFQRSAGLFVLATAIYQGILALSYIFQYVLANNGGTFLSRHDTIAYIRQRSDEFPVPYSMFSVYSMMFFFFALGFSVLNRKFAYEKLEVDDEK